MIISFTSHTLGTLLTCVLFSAAKPVDAWASRKSPLSTAILLPNLKSSVCESVATELESSTTDEMLTMPL